jgi:HSP20 family protein
VVRWDPARECKSLQWSLARLLEQYDGGGLPRAAFPVNVYETADEVIVRADLPGVNPDDVDVQLHEGRLHIRAVRREHVPEGATPLLQERGEGEYVRSFGLAMPVDPDQVQANFTDGLLEVRVPKAAHAKPRRIPVSRADAPDRVAPETDGDR